MKRRSDEQTARVAVIYYSATGNVHRLAHALAEGAEAEAVEVRLRHVEELASELLISQNQYWGRHRAEVEDEPVATLDDLEWADGVAFGTPARSRPPSRAPSRPDFRGRSARSPANGREARDTSS
jgi:NAD(P)H dehydrogenase (quinone)